MSDDRNDQEIMPGWVHPSPLPPEAVLKEVLASDDAGAIASWLIRSARAQTASPLVSPLIVAREDDLHRAWALIDLWERKRRALWHQLLAWELNDRGRAAEAQATLDRLTPPFRKWLDRYRWTSELDSYRWSSEAELYQALHNAQHEAEEGAREEPGAKSPAEPTAAGPVSHPSTATAEAAVDVANPDGDLDTSALSQAARAATQAGDFAAAFQIAIRIKERFEREYALAGIAREQTIAPAMALAREGAFEAALEQIEQIASRDDREVALQAVAALQAQAGLFVAARETAGRITGNEGRRLSALEAIAVAQAQAGQLQAAVETIQPYPRAQYEVVKTPVSAEEILTTLAGARPLQHPWQWIRLLADLATAKAEAGQFSAALELSRHIEDTFWRGWALRAVAAFQAGAHEIDAARATVRQIEDEEARGEALSAIAAAQAQAGEFGAAAETAAQIEDVSIRGDALRAVAEWQTEAGQVDAALRTTGQIEDMKWRERALVDIARAQARAGQFSAALEIAHRIATVWGRDWALFDITYAVAQRGDGTSALQAAWQIEAGDTRAEALHDIANAKLQRDDLGGALETALSLRDEDLRVEVLGKIAAAQVQAGEREAARDTLVLALQTPLTSEHEAQRVRALIDIARVQIDAGQHSEALPILAAAREGARAIQHHRLRNGSLHELVRAQMEAGALTVARETAQCMDHSDLYGTRDPGAVSDLREVAAAQREAGELEERRVTLVLARETLDRIRGRCRVDYVVQYFAAQVATQAELGEVAPALRLAERCSWDRDEGLQAIAAVQVQADALDAAQQTAARIESDSCRDNALRVIAAARARAGDVLGAQHTAAAIVGPKERALTLGDLAAALTGTRNREAVCALSDLALEAAQRIEEESSQIEALLHLAAAHAQAGARDLAQTVFAAAVGSALRFENEYWRRWAPRRIAEAQAQARELDSALETVGLIETEEDRIAALLAIARVQVEMEEWASARVTLATALAAALGTEPDGYSRSQHLATVAELQAQAGLREDALSTFAVAIESEQKIADDEWRADALRDMAVAQVRAGLGEAALRTAAAIHPDWDEHWMTIAAALAAAGDRESFKEILLRCARSTTEAYRLCALLARAYPAQSAAVAACMR